MTVPDPVHAADWLIGGGQMGQLVRARDWSRTPLGPIERWPQSLRTTVSLVLASNFPISIAWGPQRVQIYNDGYWPICGAKHPRSLGQDFKECWFSAWPVIGEAFERAGAGTAAFLENQRMFLDRYGYLEETFFTFSFSPIRDETGEVAGLFHPVTEMTGQILAERRLQALRSVRDRTAAATDVHGAANLAVRALDEHQLDVPFALVYLFDDEAKVARLCGAAHLDAGAQAAPREIPLDADAPWPLAMALRHPGPRHLDRIGERVGAIVAGPYPEPLRDAMLLPLTVPGLDRPLGALVAGVSTRRPLDATYRTFFAMLQAAVATALASARSHAIERGRAEALLEIDRAKTTFFSNVSHEFRTPLTLIRGPLETALATENLPAAARDSMQYALRNSRRLLELVNSLLDFSRLEAGRMRASFAPLDLAAVTADLASMFRSACNRAGLRLAIVCPPLPQPVWADRAMWEKVVVNLLSNAFKFTLTGSIEVSLRAEGNDAMLEVRDTGVGIPAQELPRLFDRFHRVASVRGRTHEGAGIGLALVRELVELHGGAVSVTSTVGSGTTVTVAIPFGRAHLPDEQIAARNAVPDTHAIDVAAWTEQAERMVPTDAGDAPRRDAIPATGGGATSSAARILLVDDNGDMRDYVRRLLEPRYVVETAPDGRSALARISDFQPDLVLADVMMPGLDGFELLDALREDPRTATMPVILLSARAGPEARSDGLHRGADDYVVKPFEANDLITRVESQLQIARVRRETELRFRSMADTAPVLIWEAGPDTHRTWFNKVWLDFRGRSMEQELGAGWTDGAHPEDLARCTAAYASAFARREPCDSEYRLRRHDGEWRWITDRAVPRQDASGRFVGYIGTCLDITERRSTEHELRRQMERQRLLWEAAGILLTSDQPDTMLRRLFSRIRSHVEVDAYFNFVVDETAHELRLLSCAGVDEEQIASLERLQFGQAVCGTVALERRAVVAQSIQTSDDPKVQIVKGYGIRAYACNPLLAGGRLLGTLSFASRTRDSFAEDELTFFETITHYVTAAYQQLALIADLREADRRKDRFLATLAHEVRGPLAPLSTTLELIRLQNGDPALVQEGCAIMRRQVEALTRLVDDLLDVSRITLGRVQLKRCRVELADLVRRAIEGVQPQLDEAGHELHVELPRDDLAFDADPMRLVQVLSNLLTNAIKYTPGRGRIVIRASRDGDRLRVAVRDNGIGIAREQQQSIFEMFRQLDSSLESGFKGLGIGLTLVKSLIELHGGTVEVQSEGVGMGSEFAFLLPVHEPAESVGDAVAPAANGSPRVRHRVLVVEDNRDTAQAMARLLAVLGHEVQVAFDGEEALAAAESFAPHVVLLDIGLPKINGYEVAARLRSGPRGDGVVIAAVTGWGQDTDRRRSREAGIDRHLTKPLDPAQLHSLLDEVPDHTPLSTLGATPLASLLPTDRDRSADRPAPDRLLHDLRGSLHAMMLQLRLIEQMVGGNGELRELVERALRGGSEIEERIDQLPGR